jgi:hypothetical protein
MYEERANLIRNTASNWLRLTEPHYLTYNNYGTNQLFTIFICLPTFKFSTCRSFTLVHCLLSFSSVSCICEFVTLFINSNVWWRHATFFDLLYFFVHDTGRNRRNTLLLHGCCRLEATGSRVEAGLQGALWVYVVFKVKASRGIAQCPQRGLNQTVHILLHNSAVTGSLPNGEFLQGQPNVLTINRAWQ